MAYMRPAIARIVNQKKKLETQAAKEVLKYPPYLYALFYAFGLYLVLPLIDVPLLGLSLSAPLFFIIAAIVFFKPVEPWFKHHKGWIILGLTIWLAVALSTLINEMIPGAAFNRSGMISLLQYAYWILVFIVSGYLFREEAVREKMSFFFAIGILIVAALRWYEGLVYGRMGAWSGTKFLTQNGYGFQFSVFSPFVYLRILNKAEKRKWFWAAGSLFLFVAVAFNGSRGSWVAIAIGLVLSVIAFFVSTPSKAPKVLLFLIGTVLFGFIIMSLSPGISTVITERFKTMQSLDEDKTYVVRKVLVQKGLSLFQESPFIGVGSARFTKMRVELEIPTLLQSADLDIIERKPSHNSYIQFLAEFGLAGSVPFAAMLVYLILRGVPISLVGLRKEKTGALTILIAFLQMSAHMYVMASITSSLVWVIYGYFCATIIAFDHERKQLS